MMCVACAIISPSATCKRKTSDILSVCLALALNLAMYLALSVCLFVCLSVNTYIFIMKHYYTSIQGNFLEFNN